MVVIGSRARGDHPADAWSDLDTIAFVDDYIVYTKEGGWKTDLQAAIGYPLWFAAFSQVDHDAPEWEFVFLDGLKIDIVFSANRAPTGCEASLAEMAGYFPYLYVFERGSRVLVDKDPAARPCILPAPPPRPVPGQAEFDNLIANILLELTRAAKLARRGELWRAAGAINTDVQGNLLTLIELHSGTNRDSGGFAWYYGRFLEEWADPRVLAALPDTFAENTPQGIRCAVNASLDLLAWLGPETAHRLGLCYPAESVHQTDLWLRSITN